VRYYLASSPGPIRSWCAYAGAPPCGKPQGESTNIEQTQQSINHQFASPFIIRRTLIWLEIHFSNSYNLRNTQDTRYIALRAALTILGVLYTSQTHSLLVFLVWEMIGRYRLLHHLAHEPAQGITESTHNHHRSLHEDGSKPHSLVLIGTVLANRRIYS
jgi:hypothetical protein